MRILICVLFTLLVVACGDDDGGGGPGDDGGVGDRSRTIESLDMAEARSECAALTNALGGPGERMCPGGLDIRIQSVDECATSFAAATCTNTLAEIDACISALGGDACNLFTESSCSFFVSCAM